MRRVMLVGVAAAAAALLPVGAATAAVPGENGRIAFERGSDIWTVLPDGSDERSLVVSPADEATPAWSPDGEQLAFARDGAIWVVDADGTGERKVAEAPTGAGHPAWSPDGTRIAFDTRPDGDTSKILVVDADGGATTTVAEGRAPAWSPDGTRIAFAEVHVIPFWIYYTIDSVRPDGTGLQVHSDGEGLTGVDGLDWSPDGTRIAISTNPFRSTGFEVQVLDIATRTLTTFGYQDIPTESGVAWAPDGSKLAFLRFFEGGPDFYNTRIAVWNPDGTDPFDVTSSARDSHPAWQPLPANAAPDCSKVKVTPNTLWPPNHKLRAVRISGATDPEGDTVKLAITGVTANEKIKPRDVVTRPGSPTAYLRAERGGGKRGRVYRVAFTATDPQGATCTGTVTVTVPRDRSKKR